MGAGQDHRRRPRAASRARLQRLSRRVEVDPDRLVGWVDRFVARHGAVDVRAGDETGGGGVVITSPDGATATMVPPWPPDPFAPGAPKSATPRDELEHFLAEARRPRTVGLLLVRRGGFAVGVADGTTLVDSKVGTRYVQGRTKAGGWSQQRYARRREAQANQAFGAAADVAARILLPRLDDLGGIVPGGDRAAVRAVLDDSRLTGLADLSQGRFLAVPDPRQRVLEEAVRRSRAVLVDVFDPLRD